jgi:hypothetical protein
MVDMDFRESPFHALGRIGQGSEKKALSLTHSSMAAGQALVVGSVVSRRCHRLVCHPLQDMLTAAYLIMSHGP